jgi:dTMP kinase
MSGKFISIEGSEGAGKSSILAFVQHYLKQAKREVVLTREPGGTPLAEEIRQVLLQPNSTEKMTSETELLLVFAARAQHIQQCIVPALQAGKWVVSDRFIDASYAYQGGGRGVDKQYITWLDQWVVGQVYPDLTLLLDLPPHVGTERAKSRSIQPDRIEQESMDFFLRVRDSYLQRAKEAPQRIKKIDASQPVTLVQEQIQHILDTFLHKQEQ